MTQRRRKGHCGLGLERLLRMIGHGSLGSTQVITGGWDVLFGHLRLAPPGTVPHEAEGGGGKVGRGDVQVKWEPSPRYSDR